LEALHASVALVLDLVLDDVDRPSSLEASLSMPAELLEEWIDAMATKEVRWGTQSALVAALSHFQELKFELELHGFRAKCGPD
jgi:hypothetical protein